MENGDRNLKRFNGFSNKFWIAMTGGLLIISVIAALALGRVPARQARVYQNGVLIRSISLSEVGEPYTFNVDCESGVNTVSVERGRICVSDANCHDGYCVRQGWMSGGAAPIVCLPHGLVITLDGGGGDGNDGGRRPDGTDVDAVVG